MKTDNCGYADNVACNVSESVRVCGHGQRKVGKAQGSNAFVQNTKNTLWEFKGVEVVMSVSACRNLRVWKSHVPYVQE